MSAETLGHLANVLFGAAYLVRGILWLRILSIVACTLMGFFNYFAPAEPLWVAIYWNIFFIVVNVIQVWILLRERSAVAFSDEEEELYETVFRAMSPVEFMKILRIAEWVTYESGRTFIERGCDVTELWLVSHGLVVVELEDNKKVELKDGAFLGEMAFVSGAPASGEVSTLTKTRLLNWSFAELRRLFRRNPEIKSGFQAVISADLAGKLGPRERA